MQSPEAPVKPRAVQVCLFLVRLLLLSVSWLVLLIGLAWTFGALWFDFPVSALRQPLAAVFGLSASMPFVELKRLSHINDRARAADRDPAFSSRIRDGLPGMAIPLVELRTNARQQLLTAKRE